MDAIELNAALYAKMEAEMTDFANWLLKQPPEVILNHAIEYATKFDIVSIMETTDLSADKARALLSLEEPLDAIFKDYDDSPQNSLDVLVSFIQDKADELLSTNQANAAVQVYPYSGEVAEREGDLEWYRQSHKLNIACKNEIEGRLPVTMRTTPSAMKRYIKWWRSLACLGLLLSWSIPSGKRIGMVGSPMTTRRGQSEFRSIPMWMPLVRTSGSNMWWTAMPVLRIFS